MKCKWLHTLCSRHTNLLVIKIDVEYITLSEAEKEVMFMVQLLESMQIVVKYPVMVRVHNVVAIFMESNITTISHIKHMDSWY